VIIAQGGQAKAVVLFGVFRIADARQRALHQPNHSGQNVVARQAATAQIRIYPLPDQRQCPAETEHVLELGFVTHLPPVRMVAVLLTPAGISSDGLEMAARVGADPHLCPGRRDGERLETP
jgi:hypothetical protein